MADRSPLGRPTQTGSRAALPDLVLPFEDRLAAGRALARALQGRFPPGAVVLALPRGGVPVAAEVARAFRAPLGLVLVRKIGAPGQPELAVAAVAALPGEAIGPPGASPTVGPTGLGGAAGPTSAAERVSAPGPAEPIGPLGPVEQVVDEETLASCGADHAYVNRAVPDARRELERRRRRYAAGREQPSPRGRAVVLVDDGIATGTTVRAAVAAVRQSGAARVLLAVPVAPAEALALLAPQVDELICLAVPRPFHAVGAHYRAFGQVSDEAVVALLEGNSSLH